MGLMNMTNSEHTYQKAIDTINDKGMYKASAGSKPYNLLHKLSKSLGVYMHGSQAFIGSTFDINKKTMAKLAKISLESYCQTGVLTLPVEFQYRSNKSIILSPKRKRL